MISIRCPHCHVGLKVDETKIPSHIQTFSCPKCKKPISVSLVSGKSGLVDDSETVILPSSVKQDVNVGRLLVVENELTPSQVLSLHEGLNVIGRKSSSSGSTTSIETNDKLMSRSHIVIEIKKDSKGQYKYSLYDNNSKNRTLYNCNYIEAGEVVVLKDKDEIQIGQTRLIFEE